ncbi:MAG: hypothetical protein IT210_07525 [Armatimonadetes bacterium]|nr:hypothetical protein [Armatimonadota bacterium]
MDRMKVEAIRKEMADLGCVLEIDLQGTRFYLKTPSGKTLDMEIHCELAEGCAAKLKERVEPLPVV